MLHASLIDIPMPDRIKRLPLDHRGFPVPWFVAWIVPPNVEAEPQADHRVIRQSAMQPAVRKRLCWTCGEPLGRTFVSLIGCMCSVNRVISEPPSHRDCAEYAVRACPFLARPQMHRREAGLPEQRVAAAGMALARNPGVVCLWISRVYPKPFRASAGQAGTLFQLGEPEETVWYREGRLATRQEVIDAIDDGLPNLLKPAREEGLEAITELARLHKRALNYLPAA
jgi:hypothetical protein